METDKGLNGQNGLESLTFDNSFINHLPCDIETENYRRQVKNANYSIVHPARVKNPGLGAASREAADLIDLSMDDVNSPEFLEVFSGNRLVPGMQPFATCYGGHQFGNWAGQLGDGRAINLGEIINRRGQRWAIQLKGAGPTPYSRSADGLAVLRSSVREFLCSEAMFHLGVPTTRALSLITTGEKVMRDMFYDGNPKMEPGAVVTRLSPSFTRFGSFQIHTARNEIDLLKQLMDYTIKTDFPDLGAPSPGVYLEWFNKVCEATADMIVHWMRVGFVHGVMNTDNMSILGLTIDYGPYGWLEDYDPNWTPNTTDAQGRRYSFGNQPGIALWNLAQLAQAIQPVVNDNDALEESLKTYSTFFQDKWNSMMAEKLGLDRFRPGTDERLITELLQVLALVETDMTLFFRNLAAVDPDRQTPSRDLTDAYYRPEQLTETYVDQLDSWIKLYGQRLKTDTHDPGTRQERMNRVNPKYVLRNYLAQLAIDKAEQGDFSGVTELLQVMRNPYDDQPGNERFAKKRPEWARNRPGCSMLSCSS
ncbi:MAG: YdiU family protein [Desulfobacterium sp.]|jgi:uncharacterized protein YdiU (UPF0061 family)|nr:YdiU family protein [Desulfobacterium sp.]